MDRRFNARLGGAIPGGAEAPDGTVTPSGLALDTNEHADRSTSTICGLRLDMPASA